jgi:hypothetical protein
VEIVPREIYVVSPRAMTLADLVEAAGEVDGSLALRVLDEGGSLQLVDADDVATLTIDQSREIHVATDVERLVGPLPPGPARWWTAAMTPWGPSGDQGAHVVDELSVLLGASVVATQG